MKKVLFLVIVVFAVYYGFTNPHFLQDILRETNTVAGTPTDPLARAFAAGQSNVQAQGTGIVTSILPDDNVGSRHQRFILRLPSGQTLLIAHNIDLAKRIPNLQRGDEVEFYGEYEWNNKGGVLHWTHHDPRGRHVGGWLRHKGRVYQ